MDKKISKITSKNICKLFEVANKVFPLEQGQYFAKPHHAIILDEVYGLTLNIVLQDKKRFVQTTINEKDFDWNNIELELVNLCQEINKEELR